VQNATFSENSAGESGGAIYNGQGAALTVVNSTFSGNSSPGGFGGIYNGDVRTAQVINSTLSKNSAGEGGGIYNDGTSPLRVTYSTFSENSASAGTGLGGAVFNEDAAGATTTLGSPLLARGSSGGNCEGKITDGAFNISDDATCFFTARGSRNSTDPLLDADGLQNNGGPTQTIALVRGGLAVDAVPQATNGCGTSVTTDQRGVRRPQGPRCDVGAFELTSQPGSATCTKTGDRGRNVLFGTTGKDVLCGQDGDDVLVGLGGNDPLLGVAVGTSLWVGVVPIPSRAGEDAICCWVRTG
jgi:predicted outer membrane repeat protein